MGACVAVRLAARRRVRGRGVRPDRPPSDAQRELAYLQRVQGANGLFEARYLLDGSGPPDERWAQSDGSGWALWAAAELVDSLPTHREKVAAVRPLRGLIERSLAQTLEQTRSGASLPVPEPGLPRDP